MSHYEWQVEERYRGRRGRSYAHSFLDEFSESYKDLFSQILSMLRGVSPSVAAELIKHSQFHRRAFVDLSNESGMQGTKRPRSWMVFAAQVERSRLLRGVGHGGIH